MSEFARILTEINDWKHKFDEIDEIEGVNCVQETSEYDEYGNYHSTAVFSYAESYDTRDVKFFSVNLDVVSRALYAEERKPKIVTHVIYE